MLRQDLQLLPKLVPQHANQRIAPLPNLDAKRSEMLREEAAANIFAKRRLGTRRNRGALLYPHLHQPVDPVLRPDDIAKPQAGECQLRKAANRQHVGIGIELYDGGDWPPREPQLAIVIVFD